jgi:ATP-dependent DNA ligase
MVEGAQPAWLGITKFVSELAALPVFPTLDGELWAFGPDVSPDFPLVCERMLMRRRDVRLTYLAFDFRSSTAVT